MISYKPTILVRRLVVMRNALTVMDMSFHEGLNIIAGENSSGKTTAVRFIAYCLGGENISFNPTALTCDDIYLEVEANDAPVTLRRKVTAQPMQSMEVFWGTLDSARIADIALWSRYPFKVSESKNSFSQVLFRLLGFPELKGESGSNITMHQLLRLIYSDQETPSSEIFRSDKFDRAITRAAIGDYLLGVDSTELYELKLQESNIDKDASAVRTSVKTIYSTFGQSGTKISLDFLQEQMQNIESEIVFLQAKLLDANRPTARISASKEDNTLLVLLDRAHRDLSELRSRKQDLQAEVADSELFLRELEDRLFSLEESSVAASFLGTAVFSFCPSCFSKLQTGSTEESACALCKSAVAEDSVRSQLARMRNELSIQLKESESIRKQQLDELDAIQREIPSSELELKNLEINYKRNQAQWRSPDQIIGQNISKEIGAKEQEIRNIVNLKKLADLLATLNARLDSLTAELSLIRERIITVEREQTNRRQRAYNAVADKFKTILASDLFRQTEFKYADIVDIDFGANRVFIDGHNQFSASSMIFYRHAFHLALLLASLENEYFRYPRLLILDGIEDGGMEVERSYNFQALIKKYSCNSVVKHQIIMTTMDAAPIVDTSEFIIGRKFDHDHKSISARIA